MKKLSNTVASFATPSAFGFFKKPFIRIALFMAVIFAATSCKEDSIIEEVVLPQSSGYIQIKKLTSSSANGYIQKEIMDGKSLGFIVDNKGEFFEGCPTQNSSGGYDTYNIDVPVYITSEKIISGGKSITVTTVTNDTYRISIQKDIYTMIKNSKYRYHSVQSTWNTRSPICNERLYVNKAVTIQEIALN